MLKGINYHVHFEMWERELSFVSRKITYQLTISLLKRETNETVTSKKKIIFYLITDIRQSSVKWGPLTDLSPFCPSLTQLYLWFFFSFWILLSHSLLQVTSDSKNSWCASCLYKRSNHRQAPGPYRQVITWWWWPAPQKLPHCHDGANSPDERT